MKENLFDRISRERLEAYLDGTLNGKESAEIDALLDNDAELQKFVDDYISLQMSIANTKDVAAENSGSADFEAVAEINKVIGEVNKQSASDQEDVVKPFVSWKRVRWVASIACVLVLGFVGYMLVSPVIQQSGDDGAVRGGEPTFGGSGTFDPGVDYGVELEEIDSRISDMESGNSSQANSDLYELKWQRVQLLKQMNDYEELEVALEEILDYDGCHQSEAEDMLFDYFGR